MEQNYDCGGQKGFLLLNLQMNHHSQHPIHGPCINLEFDIKYNWLLITYLSQIKLSIIYYNFYSNLSLKSFFDFCPLPPRSVLINLHTTALDVLYCHQMDYKLPDKAILIRIYGKGKMPPQELQKEPLKIK